MRHGVSGASRKQSLHPIPEMGLLVLSAALFSCSFPNPINFWGFGPVGFIALIPLLVLVNRTTWPRLFFYAPLAGFSTYVLFNYWLAAYHPLAIFIVGVIYAAMYLVLLVALKLVRDCFPRHGWVIQLIIWVAFEYLRTLGFLGYPYGIMGYTQYLFLPLANIASFGGVWLVSLLVVWPGVLVAWGQSAGWLLGLQKMRWQFALWLATLAMACLLGSFSMVDYAKAPTKRLVLIQQNIDPWIGGTVAYSASLKSLIRQTDLALAQDPAIQMVVWSETSFIPAIEYHFRFRDDPERFELVRQLKDYIAAKSVPFVLGNGEAEPYTDINGNRARRDYNAVLLYEGRELKQSYRKLHLVPFTEHFPYEKQFPWIYHALVDSQTSLWEEGRQLVVMRAAGFSFGTPICFEDSFGDLSRDFVNAGAEMIINLSNDSWSKSVPAAMQHLAMASFRAIENRRSVVRSTNGGMSGLIDPNGRIVALNQPFTESYLIVDAPVFTTTATLYRFWGDWLGILCLVAAGGSLPLGLVLQRRRRGISRDRGNIPD